MTLRPMSARWLAALLRFATSHHAARLPPGGALYASWPSLDEMEKMYLIFHCSTIPTVILTPTTWEFPRNIPG